MGLKKKATWFITQICWMGHEVKDIDIRIKLCLKNFFFGVTLIVIWLHYKDKKSHLYLSNIK